MSSSGRSPAENVDKSASSPPSTNNSSSRGRRASSIPRLASRGSSSGKASVPVPALPLVPSRLPIGKTRPTLHNIAPSMKSPTSSTRSHSYTAMSNTSSGQGSPGNNSNSSPGSNNTNNTNNTNTNTYTNTNTSSRKNAATPDRYHPRQPPKSQATSSMPDIVSSAMQSLPIPVTILDDSKGVVLINDSMRRLLQSVYSANTGLSSFDSFDGLTLSQLGVDVLDNGQPNWVSLNTILDHISAKDGGSSFGPESVNPHEECDLPTSEFVQKMVWDIDQSDYTFEIVFSPSISRRTSSTNLSSMASTPFVFSSVKQVCAKMIVTSWAASHRERYFTLTFTKTDPVINIPIPDQTLQPPLTNSTSTNAASTSEDSAKSPRTILAPAPSRPIRPAARSPASEKSEKCSFLSSGPPNAHSRNESTLLQKVMKMKDAMIDNTTMPIVGIWKDRSLAYPNHAARQLFAKNWPESLPVYLDDLVSGWSIWDQDFTRKLAVEEYPMNVLIDSMKPFQGLRIGIVEEDDKRLVFDVLGEIIYDPATKEPIGGIVSYRDVTEMAEDIVRYRKAEDEKFRFICDSMPQLVWTSNAEGNIDYFNHQWYDYTGLRPADCKTDYLEEIIHPEDAVYSRIEWNKSLESGQPFQVEYRCRGRDGEYRWFLCRALPIRETPDGPITTWFGTSTDVHSAVINNRMTERTKEQLKSVMAHARATLFTVDLDQNVTMLEGGLVGNGISARKENGVSWYIGRNVYTVFGEIIGQLPHGTLPTFLHPIEGVLAGHGADQVEEHDINGRWYRTRFVPIMSSETADGPPEIEGAIGVIMDVTEHYAAIEAETKRRHQAMANEEAANEATRLKSQFLANMSHEFRTPLQWVLGYVEILNSTALTKEQEATVATIQNSATLLLTLINDILDFSKIESGKMALDEIDFQLSTVLTAVTEMRLFEAKKKKIQFYINYAPGVPELNLVGDCNRLGQVLNNLLDNSMKFTREGFVAFEVDIEDQTEEDITIKFTICDSGIGIHPSKLGHIYEPFLQGDASTAREFGGTGLGLSICKSFLDLMHGRINHQSTASTSAPGIGGTTAVVHIPFRKASSHGACASTETPVCSMSAIDSDCEDDGPSGSSNGNEGLPRVRSNIGPNSDETSSKKRPSTRTHSTVSSKPSLPPRDRINILLVEDNRVNARLMLKLLARMNFTRCVHMWNGQEGLDYVEQAMRGDALKPDVILMDCQMPILDGYECAEALRTTAGLQEYVADVPIIAVTASAVSGDRERCLASGMNDYLLKPITQTVLERSIMQHLTLMRLPRATLSVPTTEPMPSSPTANGLPVLPERASSTDLSGSAPTPAPAPASASASASGSGSAAASLSASGNSTPTTTVSVSMPAATSTSESSPKKKKGKAVAKRPPAVTSLSSMSMSSYEATSSAHTSRSFSDVTIDSSSPPTSASYSDTASGNKSLATSSTSASPTHEKAKVDKTQSPPA